MNQKTIDFLTIIMFLICIGMSLFLPGKLNYVVVSMLSFIFICFLIEAYNGWICKKILGTWYYLLM